MKLEDFLFSKDEWIQQAIDMGDYCVGGPVKLTNDIKDIENLDIVVDKTRNLVQKKMLDDNTTWNVSTVLGTLLGEMIIKKHNFKWTINDEEIPVVETQDENQLSPITKIYKILTSEVDDEGSPSSFYSGFLALEKLNNMSEDEKKEITTYWHDGKFIPATEWKDEEDD